MYKQLDITAGFEIFSIFISVTLRWNCTNNKMSPLKLKSDKK